MVRSNDKLLSVESNNLTCFIIHLSCSKIVLSLLKPVYFTFHRIYIVDWVISIKRSLFIYYLVKNFKINEGFYLSRLKLYFKNYQFIYYSFFHEEDSIFFLFIGINVNFYYQEICNRLEPHYFFYYIYKLKV